MDFDRNKSDRIAESVLEKQWEKGGRGPEKFDCMGIMIHYFREFDVVIPDYSAIKDWGEYDAEYVSAIPRVVRRLRDDEKPMVGDVVIFSKVVEQTGALNHAGIVLGDSKFLHTSVKLGTRIDALYQSPWKEHVYGYFRLKDEASD